MKFLTLEIKNLASLDKQDGEVINFEEGALKASNIFSIVGPTGSGKSTILDAICLALYNRAPRYPRKARERNPITIFGEADEVEKNRLSPTDGRNILTRGKKEGYSKLTFLANDGCTYRAEWHVQFKTKKYDEVETFLYKLTFSTGVLHEEKVDWTTLPQIIGLDYEQFLRTVLIAQGSFAEFLKQSDDQRFELLEKLIGCEDLYTGIAEKIKEKAQQAKEDYQNLNTSNEVYSKNDLTSEELDVLNAEIDALTEKENEIKNKLANVNKALEWFVQEEKHLENLKNYEADQQRCQEAVDMLKEKAARLALHDATVEAVSLYKEMMDKEKAIQHATTQLNNLGKDKDGLAEKLSKANEELNKRKETYDAHTTKYNNGKPHIEAARVLKGELNSDRQNLQAQEETLRQANEQLKNASDAVIQNAEAIKKADELVNQKTQVLVELRATIEQVTEQLKAEADQANKAYEPEKQKLEGLNPTELQRRVTEALESENDLKEVLRIQRELQSKKKQQGENEQTVKKLTVRNLELDEKLGTLTIEKLTAEVGALERTCTLMSSENWEKHRSELQEGEKCPLCGATHHPYANDADYQKDLNEIEQILKDKKVVLEQQKENRENWNGEKITNETTINQLNQSTLPQEIKNLQENWDVVHQRHANWPSDAEALEAMQEGVSNEKQLAVKTLNDYNDLHGEVEELRQKKDDADKKLQAYKETSAQQQQNANNDVNTAKTTLQTERGKTENLLRQQEQYSEAQKKASNAYDELEKGIQEKQQKMERHVGKYDPDALEAELLKRKENAEKLVKEQEGDVNQYKQHLSAVDGQIDSVKKQLEDFDKEKQESSGNLDGWLASHSDLNINREAIAQLYVATDNWEDYRSKINDCNNACTCANTTLDNEKKAHEKHQASKPESSREELDAKKKELESWSNEELVGKRTRLQQYNEAREAMGELRDKLTAAAQLKKNWEEISKAIGSDGKDLRKIAQIYTLHFLVEHANAEIRKFNNRYELQQIHNSLGLRIIDHDRADDIRDITTLSGGETFIISLGLALGLSSLSSNNIAFGNLFVDEGFGTLDPDMLATVIDSLAALQSSQGKKVGVISHTDTMSERITTQIRIIKNGNSGSSHIEIYPN